MESTLTYDPSQSPTAILERNIAHKAWLYEELERKKSDIKRINKEILNIQIEINELEESQSNR